MNCCHTWDKPLNPILGETFQSYLPDGTKIFCEQVSHKPPVSYCVMEGPNNLYRWFGYAKLSVKAYFNSISLDVGGFKQINFSDGSSIHYTNQDDIFGNTLLGVMHHQLIGTVKFTDERNGITAELSIGNERGKPRDYFSGAIFRDGSVVSKLTGTYMGYVDFDGKRYLDLRQQQIAKIMPMEFQGGRDYCLQSDSRFRIDAMELGKDVEQAQRNKETLEVL